MNRNAFLVSRNFVFVGVVQGFAKANPYEKT
jgi:hypothetical protein